MAKNHVFVGLYGSGKTELAINYAIRLKKESQKVAIADVDIVSPYFRIRDFQQILHSHGIVVITAPEKLMNADLPIVTASVAGYLDNPEYRVVLDIGGDERGIVVLGYLKEHLVDTNVYLVVNTKRPFSQRVEQIVQIAKALENRSGVKIDFLVNNTNLGSQTSPEIINEGEVILQQVSEILEKPVAFTVVADSIDYDGKFNVVHIERFVKSKEESS
ncbi:P-loop NTPase family protein [Thermotoga profunda]|uniref:cobalamin biosynthesis protein CobQ n=1 Tax=Thermotoga profunda TaxID=1508420 RepID=UPI000596F4C4|nr:cobalamin biosynthesis protein CobQ [Thermotoga profunda]